MIQLYREKRVRETLLYDLFRTCRNHPWLPSKTHMTRKRKMTRPSDSNMIFELIFCLDLHLWMCRRERPWPRIGWYQVISIPKLPKPSPSHQNATSWCGRLMRRRRRNSKGGLAVRNPVPAKCSCHTGQLRYFLPPGFLLVRKTQTGSDSTKIPSDDGSFGDEAPRVTMNKCNIKVLLVLSSLFFRTVKR